MSPAPGLAAIALAFLPGQEEGAGPGPGGQAGELELGAVGSGVSRVALTGQLEIGMLSHLRRAFDEVEERGDRLILEIDTPGGEVELMWRMANAVADASDRGITTVAWVNDRAHSAGALVAMAAKLLYMRPHASIGSALPVTVGPGGLAPAAQDESVAEKLSSTLRSEFRGLAERMGRSPLLAEAMVDPAIEVREVEVGGEVRLLSGREWDDLRMRGEDARHLRVVVSSGELLNLTGTEAVALGLADGLANTMEELTGKVAGRPAVPREIRRTPSEELAGWLYMLTPLFIVLGFVLAYVELKVPGFGIPGILSIACFGVVLFGRYLVGLADVPHAVLIVAGILALAVEIFLIPGTIWVGLLGGLFVLAGLSWSLAGDGFTWTYELERRILVDEAFRVVSAALLAAFLMWGLSRVLPRTPVFSRLVLSSSRKEPTFAGAMPEAAGEHARVARVGAAGRALTALRPVGKVALEDAPELEFEARSEGRGIESGASVRVIEVEPSGRLLVRES